MSQVTASVPQTICETATPAVSDMLDVSARGSQQMGAGASVSLLKVGHSLSFLRTVADHALERAHAGHCACPRLAHAYSIIAPNKTTSTCLLCAGFTIPGLFMTACADGMQSATIIDAAVCHCLLLRFVVFCRPWTSFWAPTAPHLDLQAPPATTTTSGSSEIWGGHLPAGRRLEKLWIALAQDR